MSKCQIIAMPTHIKYANKNGFVVLAATDEAGHNLTLAGSYDSSDMNSEKGFLHHRFCFFGEQKHTDYGEQFAFNAYSMICDGKEEEMFYFLTRMVSGVNETKARELIERFGDTLAYVIENEPEQLTHIKGIKEKKVKNIQKSWKDKKYLLNLTGILAPYGISNSAIKKIFETFGERAQDKIMENPYILTSVKGFGFKKTDEIAQKLGFDMSSIHRIKAAILYCMQDKVQGFGDTFAEEHILIDLVLQLFETDTPSMRARIEEGLHILIDEGKLKTHTHEDTLCLFLSHTYDKEEYIYTTLRLFKNRTSEICSLKEANDFIHSFEQEHHIAFSLEQKEAILMAQNGNKLISITGAAGTGKTSVSKAILGLLEKKYSKHNIVCCALSGVAAARVRKQSGYQSFTIHSLLEYDPIERKFKRNESNPLEANVVLLDEASMVEVNIFHSLLKAIDLSKTHLILLGDSAQLLPVGCGEIFNDILSHKLTSIIRLTKIFRQSENSALTLLADEVRIGRVPDYQENKFEDFYFQKIDIPYFWNLKKTSSPEVYKQRREEIQQDILQYSKKVFARASGLLNEQFKDTPLSGSALWDRLSFFQIITPQKDGVLGVKNLNKEAQSLFNPQNIEGHCFQAQEYDFKLGDKVIHLVNKNMQVILENGEEEERRVFNGQIGMISKIDLDEDEIQVSYPNEGYVAIYGQQEFKNSEITLAYAISVHKSQGSEFTRIFIPFTMNHAIMLNSKLIYTAMTRAKLQAICAGESYAFEMGCKRKNVLTRKTLLKLLSSKT